MNLRDLQYLTAVAELRSFVQAAEQCHISQPTLSMQIKKLEERLGVQIFERNNKRVLITEVGELILERARQILQQVEQINELADFSRDPLSGNLRIGAFPTLSTYIFPALVSLIKQRLPRIRLILVEEKTDELVRQMKNGQIDMALLALPIFDELLQTQTLFEDPFLLAVADDHPFASMPSVKLTDLSGQQLLLLDEGHCLRGHALQICQLHGAEEEQDVRATGLETLRQMVRAGTGITLMPHIAIKNQDEGIRYIPFQAPTPTRTIGLVWRASGARSDLTEQLIPLIRIAANKIDFPTRN